MLFMQPLVKNDDLDMFQCLSGPEALELKKTILRHCLLSMTMVYIIVSPPFRESLYLPEDLIQKGLSDSSATSRWLIGKNGRKLTKNNAVKHYRERWWQPLLWCSHIIQENDEYFPNAKNFLAEKYSAVKKT